MLAVVVHLTQDHCETALMWAGLRAALSALVDADERWPGFSAGDEQRFNAYYALHRRHLLDENSVVYPAARSVVRGEALLAMGAEMMGRRGTVG